MKNQAMHKLQIGETVTYDPPASYREWVVEKGGKQFPPRTGSVVHIFPAHTVPEPGLIRKFYHLTADDRIFKFVHRAVKVDRAVIEYAPSKFLIVPEPHFKWCYAPVAA